LIGTGILFSKVHNMSALILSKTKHKNDKHNCPVTPGLKTSDGRKKGRGSVGNGTVTEA
jgi:hypothetical protein